MNTTEALSKYLDDESRKLEKRFTEEAIEEWDDSGFGSYSLWILVTVSNKWAEWRNHVRWN